VKPWMWAVVGVVALLLLGGLFWVLASPTAEPDPVSGAPPAPPDPAPEPAADPTLDPELTVLEGQDAGQQIPMPPPPEEDEGPDITPEHVEADEFNAVLDDVVDTCGLGVWSEVERGCTDWRCTVLVAVPADDSQPYPSVQGIVECPAWLEAWGNKPDYTVTRVECDDGVELDIASVGPSTLRMRRAVTENNGGDAFLVDPDQMREQACATWGT